MPPKRAGLKPTNKIKIPKTIVLGRGRGTNRAPERKPAIAAPRTLPTTRVPTITALAPRTLPSYKPTVVTKPAKSFAEKFRSAVSNLVNHNNTVGVPAGLSPSQRTANAVNPPPVRPAPSAAAAPRPTISDEEYETKFGVSNKRVEVPSNVPAQYRHYVDTVINPTTETDKWYPTPESSGRDTQTIEVMNIDGELVPFTSQTAVAKERRNLIDEGRVLGWDDERINSALAVYDATNGIQKVPLFNVGTWEVEEVGDISSPSPVGSGVNLLGNTLLAVTEAFRAQWQWQSPVRIDPVTGNWRVQTPLVFNDNAETIKSQQDAIDKEKSEGGRWVQGANGRQTFIPTTAERQIRLEEDRRYLEQRMTRAKEDAERYVDALEAVADAKELNARAVQKFWGRRGDSQNAIDRRGGIEVDSFPVVLKDLFQVEFYDTPEKIEEAKVKRDSYATQSRENMAAMDELYTTGRVQVSPGVFPTIQEIEEEQEARMRTQRMLSTEPDYVSFEDQVRKLQSKLHQPTEGEMQSARIAIQQNPEYTPEDISDAALFDYAIQKQWRELVRASGIQMPQATDYATISKELTIEPTYRVATTEDAKALYDKALEAKREEQKIRYQLEAHNPTMAATWTREPWRYEHFLNNLAMAELQMGREPSLLEIRQLKQQSTNMGTEFAFEATLDVTNVIEPIQWADEIVPGFKAARQAFGGSIKNGFITGLRKVPGFGWFFRETISTVASKNANKLNEALNVFRMAYPADVKAFVDDLPRFGDLLAANAGKTDNELRAVFLAEKEANRIRGLANISFESFKELRELADPKAGGIAPSDWRKLYEDSITKTEATLADWSTKDAERNLKKVAKDLARKTGNAYVPPSEAQIKQEALRILKDKTSDTKWLGMAQDDFVSNFQTAYEAPHRLYIDAAGRASRIMDDTMFGQITQKFRMLGGKLDDMPRVQALDKLFKQSDLVTRKKLFWKETFNAVEGKVITFGDRIDQAIISMGREANTISQASFTALANMMEGLEYGASLMYQFWAMSVLSMNPRWYIQNLIDSSGRSFLEGGNPLGDLFMIFNGSHLKLIDDLGGNLPIELIQMARAGISPSESVVGRLVYGDFKPYAGPLSWWKAEQARQLAEFGQNVAESSGSVRNIVNNYDNVSPLMKNVRALKQNIKAGFLAIPNAASDFNTAIEFTVRLRMFHKEYFKILDELEPIFLTRGMDKLSEPVRELALRLMRDSGFNSAQLLAMVDDIVLETTPEQMVVQMVGDVKTIKFTSISKEERRARAWSVLFNNSIHDRMQAMTAAEKSNFLSDVSLNFHELRKAKLARGEDIIESDIDNFIDSYRDNMRFHVQTKISEFQEGMAGNMDVTGIGSTFAKPPSVWDIFVKKPRTVVDGVVSKTEFKTLKESFDTLKKSVSDFVSAPTSPDELVGPSANELKFKKKSSDLIKSFTDAVSPFGTVQVTKTDVAKVYVKDGQIVMELSESLLESRPSEVIPILSDMVIQSIAKRDETMIKSLGLTNDHYIEAFNLFVHGAEGPTALLARRDRTSFRLISQQLLADPHLRKVLENINGKPIIFDAASVIDPLLKNDAVEAFNSAEWIGILEATGMQNSKAPIETLLAGDAKAITTDALYDALSELGDETSKQHFQHFLNMSNVMDGQLQKFNFYTGPAVRTGDLRKKAWDFFWENKTDYLNKAADRNRFLLGLFKDDPEQAIKEIVSYNEDFARRYLDDMGIKNIVLNDAGEVSSFTMKFADGKMHNLVKGGAAEKDIAKSLTAYFFSNDLRLSLLSISTPTMMQPDLIKKGIPAVNQISDGLRMAFNSENKHLTVEQAHDVARVIDAHIKELVSDGGVTYEEVLKRIGFARIKGPMLYGDVLTLARNKSQDLDKILIYGFGNQHSFKGIISQMSNMFYADLAWVGGEARNAKAVANLRSINKLIQDLTGSPVLSGKLTPYQSEMFADIFEKFIKEGADNIEYKPLFEKFRGYLSRSFKDIHADNIINENITPETYMLLEKVFLGTKPTTPTTNSKIIKFAAKKAGLPGNEADLLNMINTHPAVLGINNVEHEALIKSLTDAGMDEQMAQMTFDLLRLRSVAFNPENPGEWLRSVNIVKGEEVDLLALAREMDGHPLFSLNMNNSQLDSFTDQMLAGRNKNLGEMKSNIRAALDDASPDERLHMLAYLDKKDRPLAQEMAKYLTDNKKLFQTASTLTEKAAGFKSWFDGSAVVDETGKPQVMYHGSSNVDFDTLDPEKIASGNLYGPGFYFTDSPVVASSYTDKGVMTGAEIKLSRPPTNSEIDELFGDWPDMSSYKSNQDIRFYKNDVVIGVPEDEISQLNAKRAYLKSQLKSYDFEPEMIAKASTSYPAAWKEMADRLLSRGIKVEPTVKKGILPVYMSIKNPFDMDRFYTFNDIHELFGPTMGEAITSHIRKRFSVASQFDDEINATRSAWLAAEHVQGDTLWNMLQDVPATNVANDYDANALLHTAGFDGITHTGGRVVGGLGEHKVYIAFEPTQVKSIYNSGAFDPNNPNMLYQLGYNKDQINTMVDMIFRSESNTDSRMSNLRQLLNDANAEEKKLILERVASKGTGIEKSLYQTGGNGKGLIEVKKGAYWMEDGKRMIALFKDKDVTTVPHEMMHDALNEIAKKDDWMMREVERYTGIKKGSFSKLQEAFKAGDQTSADYIAYVNMHEKMANAGVHYIYTQQAPTPELRNIFEWFKKKIGEVWQGVKDMMPDLDKGIIKVFDAVYAVDPSMVRIPRRYGSLGEVPVDLAEKVFNIKTEERISNELEAAFKGWRQKRNISMFPEEATSSYKAFKEYLDTKIYKNDGVLEDQYRNIRVELENFADGVGRLHYGDELEKFLNPVIPTPQMGETAQTVAAQAAENMRVYEGMEATLEEIRKYWKTMYHNGGSIIPVMSAAEKADFVEWGKIAASNKAELARLAVMGGEFKDEAGKVLARSDGALPKTNKVLLDYQTRTNFDAMMKNFFPFWMFPSRSLPYWAGAMIEHPAIPAMYFRIKRASETARYQAGAIDSTGRPMTSMDGYIPIPGTDSWFNPLAPFSFRYLLDITKSLDNMRYKRPETEETLTGFAYVVKEFMTSAPIIGFNLSPWTGLLVKRAFGIPDDVLPQWSITPQFNLIPKWQVRPFIESDWGGPLTNGVRDFAAYWMFPEPSWQDALIEKKILENYNAKWGNSPASADSMAEAKLVAKAIIDKGDNELWVNTYKELTQDEATRNFAAFFTGVYTKTFTDGSADLIALKMQSRELKLAMNDHFVGTVLGMPVDDEERWNYYLEKYKYGSDKDNITPAQFVSRMYSDIGWVKNSEGKVITDANERNKFLGIQIELTEKSRLNYFARKALKEKLDRDISTLVRVGSPREATDKIYTKYFEDLLALNEGLPEYVYFVNSNKPISLVERDLRNQWWQQIKSTMPAWEADFRKNEINMAEWEKNLPDIAKNMARPYSLFYANMEARFSDDQRAGMNNNFVNSLLKETTPEGYQQYRLENDSLFDAANEVFKRNYWNRYWDAVEGKSGDVARFAKTEFENTNPVPTEEIIYKWLRELYGDRFSYGQVRALMGATPETAKSYYDPDLQRQVSHGALSIQERLDYGKSPEQLAVNRIWEILGWAGPSTGVAKLREAYRQAGGDKSDIDTFYATEGTGFNSQPEKLLLMEKVIMQAAQNLKLTRPSGDALKERIKAAELKEKFISNVKADPELGPKFLDYEDAALGIPRGTYAEYTNQDFDALKAWKKNNPEKWKQVQYYKNLQKQYARENPLYAAYYTEYVKLGDLGLPEQTPTAVEANPATQNNPAFFQPSATPESIKERPSVRPSNTDSASLAPQRNISRLSMVPWPKGFAKTVGMDIVSEIDNLYKNGEWLSMPAKEFLYDLAKRHREWRGFIYGVLSK